MTKEEFALLIATELNIDASPDQISTEEHILSNDVMTWYAMNGDFKYHSVSWFPNREKFLVETQNYCGWGTTPKMAMNNFKKVVLTEIEYLLPKPLLSPELKNTIDAEINDIQNPDP